MLSCYSNVLVIKAVGRIEAGIIVEIIAEHIRITPGICEGKLRIVPLLRMTKATF